MFLLFALLLNSLLTLGFTPKLPKEEVDGLRQIGQKLGKTDWNFNVDPCTWERDIGNETYANYLTCDCSNSLCHVTGIYLTGQNLQGSLPPELIKLPFLQEIDLSQNFLNGTIPTEWASLTLVKISLFGNRLSGTVPKELGNITTLTDLILESNRFSGPLPLELGNLVNLEAIRISSNEFVGELPATLAKLTKLKDFRISDNNFSGRIPNFIQNWTGLERVEIQASGLNGPIPFEISLLKNLTDIRISDISGPESPFPLLSPWNTKVVLTLILRNCNLIGTFSDFIESAVTSGNFSTSLETLDLSFNKLNGTLSESASFYSFLFGKLKFLYLTSNLLTGLSPDSVIYNTEFYIDLSYNNFTSSTKCQVDNRGNLFGSSTIGNNSTKRIPCLQNYQCPGFLPWLHINCGGPRVTINGATYVEDLENGSPSSYFNGGEGWAIINTGDFDGNIDDNYLATNNSRLLVNTEDASQLYTTARISPLSLTYYGLCLENGYYTVQLHFAEIILRNDNTFYNVGKRVFNVYIQGKLVLQDFNIVNEAGGAGKAVVKFFKDVGVTNNGLEIRLIWAGKGSQNVPVPGTYGPLISAISITNKNFHPSSKKLSALSIAGIVVGVAGIFLVLGFLWWKGCVKGKPRRHPELRGLDLQTSSFTFKQINAATNYFDIANKIGEGGFGPVYKGILSDGTMIAVKQLSSQSKQGNREFVNEIGMISALQHPNLVKLLGCCIEGDQLLLIYEYMENNSLARALWGPEKSRLKLDWPTRHKICVGIARGLAFLHQESRLKIVHRDIKATNVLLDKDLNARISDFGLAKLDEEDNTHINTRIAGTYGYMAPEYAMRGYLTDKADVYSFGIVALEIVSGKCNANYRPNEEGFYLLDWAHNLQGKGTLEELIDPNLGSEFNKEEAVGMINIALLCSSTSSTARPTMSAVVSMLEGRVAVQEVASDPSYSIANLFSNAMINNLQHSNTQTQSESEIQSLRTGSSTSVADLYPSNLDSEYWNNKVETSSILSSK